MYVRVGADSSPPSFGKVSNQLNSDLTVNNFGTRVDLSSYNSSSNIYTIPTDGYVYIFASANDAYRGGIAVFPNSIGDPISISAHGERSSLFVRKGMRVYTYVVAGTPEYYFMPLE